LWQCKDSFGENSTGDRHQQYLRSAAWYRNRINGERLRQGRRGRMARTRKCCSCRRSAASETEEIRDTMFPVSRYQKHIDIHHATGSDTVSLQNSSRTDARCSQQAAETLSSVGTSYSLCSSTLPPYTSSSSSSFLGSTAQLRPWLNFLEASQQFPFLQGRVVSPTPNPHPGGLGLCIYNPQRQSGYPF
jgi:hypothetical protein